MKRALKAVFAAMFILILTACSATSSSPYGRYSDCGPSSVVSRCMVG